MDIRRRGSQQKSNSTGKPARSLADIQKNQAMPVSQPAAHPEPDLPIIPKSEPQTTIKQAEDILPAAPPEAAEITRTEVPTTEAAADSPTEKKETDASIKTIEIKIVLPALFSLSKAAELSKQPIKPVYRHVKKQVAKTSKRTRIATAALALTAVALVVVYTQFFTTDSKIITDTQAANRPIALQPGTPDYPTLLPASKSIEELGGWRRLSPPDKNPVYVYADTIGGTSISVSQQPLPDEFKSDTVEKVRQLSADFNANEKVTIGNTVVFIGKSAEGPQSVIFHKDNLLILMKSRGEIKNAQWADYIKELR